mmetsp:Transcript_29816/g.53947  ORF Transcript_29816/g.53947 Transcript_29816/m.53947 type:complete len:82 (+) Transcript_29816:1057-1302(+)
MMAYCGHIIENSPVLGERALRQYHNAYDKHLANMEQLDGKHVDHLFWPNPEEGDEKRWQNLQHHDMDSEDCCYLPDHSNCG